MKENPYPTISDTQAIQEAYELFRNCGRPHATAEELARFIVTVKNFKKYEVVSDRPDIQALYMMARKKGASHRFAEMMAFQSPPRVLTDNVYFQHYRSQGVSTLADQFRGQEHVLEGLLRRAKQKFGFTPNINSVWEDQLASEWGDPNGFVGPTDGRGHIQRVCEERGVTCEGSVTVLNKREPVAEIKEKRLHPNIVRRKVNEMVMKNPDLARVNRRDLEAEVVHKHGAEVTDVISE